MYSREYKQLLLGHHYVIDIKGFYMSYIIPQTFNTRFCENINLSAAGLDNAAFLERCNRDGFCLL